MPKYQAALFDLDDTLFDHQFHRRQALSAVRDRFASLRHVTIAQLEHTHDVHLQRTHRAWLAGELTLEQARTDRLRGMLSDFGCNAGDAEVELAEQGYRRAYDRDWRTVPGAPELLKQLRGAGIVIAVITNGRTSGQHAKIQALDLAGSIDEVFVSEAVGAEKPARAFFDHVTGRLALARWQCVVVGDLWETDVRGALDCGIDAIWLNRYARVQPVVAGVTQITSLQPTQQVARLFL